MRKPRDRPIDLSDAEAAAAIAGRKTEYRLPIWPGPEPGREPGEWLLRDPHSTKMTWTTNRRLVEVRVKASGRVVERREYSLPLDEFLVDCCPCPPGTVLWGREAWAPRLDARGKADPNPRYVKYRADMGHVASPAEPEDWHRWPDRWRSPRSMPRWASRLSFVVVESVRVEALLAITEDGARAEGCDGDCPVGYIPAYQAGPLVYHFAQVWDERVAHRPKWADAAGLSVWVLGIRKAVTPEDV